MNLELIISLKWCLTSVDEKTKPFSFPQHL